MKNILRIIASDVERLSKNVVAYVVIIGLTVIPSLYAWFNILSNWDPYGPDATCNLQVAVASVDKGITIGEKEVNVGEMIISNLKENKSIGWVFTDTADEAIDGVHAGDYYAALVIDEEFSSDLVSFLSGDIENPNIIYYENDKKNAIAPKITGKVKTTIQNSVNQAFISTLTETFVSASEYLVNQDENGDVTGAAITKLKNLDSDINAVILILDSYISLMDSTENLMNAGQAVSDSVDSMLNTAETMAQSTEASVDIAESTVDTLSKALDSSFNSINTSLEVLQRAVKDLQHQAETNTNQVAISAEAVKYAVEELEKQKNNEFNKKIEDLNLIENEDIKQLKKAVDDNFEQLKKDTNALQEQSIKTNEDIKNISTSLNKDINNCKDSLYSLNRAYKTTVAPQFASTFTSVNKSVDEIQRILNYNASSIDLVAASLGSYPDMMSQPKDSLLKSKAEAEEMEAKLSKLIEDMENMNSSDQYQKFLELAKNDPAFLGEFISSPVKVSEEYVYPVENNGSMTAPFYIVLSIWVGSLIMSTILKTEIKDKSLTENASTLECFFGRFFVTYVIGQIQTIITVLGALFFVQIQCKHPLMLILACSWTSFVYALLLYSFTYSFGNVGEALAVVLMVIQVAGAGGTFPIEVLPKAFQVLYKFMPFNYSMNAVRECIGGLYKANYWMYLGILTIFAVIGVLIGVFLYEPCKILNEQIEKSKEKSGILI